MWVVERLSVSEELYYHTLAQLLYRQYCLKESSVWNCVLFPERLVFTELEALTWPSSHQLVSGTLPVPTAIIIFKEPVGFGIRLSNIQSLEAVGKFTSSLASCYTQNLISLLFVCFGRDSPHWARASSFTRFLDRTQRRIAVGRTPVNEWSIRRRDLYLTTHDTHNRHTSMPPVGFEPTLSADERPQTYTLDRAATATG